MTEQIDHVAEAQKWIDFSADLNPEVDYPRIAHAALLAAQHAALAGVEQQRIANLIAVAQMEGGPYKEANGWTRKRVEQNGFYVGDEDVNPYIREEIRMGLGL